MLKGLAQRVCPMKTQEMGNPYYQTDKVKSNSCDCFRSLRSLTPNVGGLQVLRKP
jgi:hypothetical protein